VIVLYGDFNCPYSVLASARVDRLLDRGMEVEWRAVEHHPDLPVPGLPLTPKVAAALDRELAEVAEAMVPGEDVRLARPPVRSNTAAAVAAYAATAADRRSGVRRALFRAIWEQGRDIGRPEELEAVAGPAGAPGGQDGGAAELPRRWQAAWDGIERHVVPLAVLPDGYISRGLGALSRLARLVDES
jgi:2-hydroxychromene-2-carboxylate isomerase